MRLAEAHRREHRAEHAGRVRDRRAHEVRRARGDPDLRCAGSPRAACDACASRPSDRSSCPTCTRARTRRPDRARRSSAAGVGRVDDVPADAPYACRAGAPRRSPTTTCSVEVGERVGRRAVDDVEVVDVAVPIGGDVGAGAALIEDEAHFLGAVDVHDRHEHVAAHREAVERDDRFAPVRQLERDRRRRARCRRRGASSPVAAIRRGRRRRCRATVGVPTRCARRVGAARSERSTSAPSVSSVHQPLGEVLPAQRRGHGPHRPARVVHHATRILPTGPGENALTYWRAGFSPAPARSRSPWRRDDRDPSWLERKTHTLEYGPATPCSKPPAAAACDPPFSCEAGQLRDVHGAPRRRRTVRMRVNNALTRRGRRRGLDPHLPVAPDEQRDRRRLRRLTRRGTWQWRPMCWFTEAVTAVGVMGALLGCFAAPGTRCTRRR